MFGLSDLFLSEEDRENARLGDEAEQKLRELNERAATAGKYDPGTYKIVQDHYDNPAGGRVTSANADQLVEDAFLEGLGDGYKNVTGAIKTTINAPLHFLWDSIPGWVWIAGLGAGYLYLAGPGALKGVLKR